MVRKTRKHIAAPATAAEISAAVGVTRADAAAVNRVLARMGLKTARAKRSHGPIGVSGPTSTIVMPTSNPPTGRGARLSSK